MPIFRPNKTKCSICGEIIEGGEDIIAFSIIPVPTKEMWEIFGDSIIHRKCFNEHPLKYKLRNYIKEKVSPSDQTLGWLHEGIDDYFDEDFSDEK